MNDTQIRCFLLTAKYLNFTKAATELFISQPALSRHIAMLEQELKIKLFNRSNRSVSLTTAGEWFYALFDEFDARLFQTIARAKALEGMQTGKVLLGCMEGWNASEFFPPLVERLSKKYPQIQLILENRNFSGLKSSLKNNRTDAVIALNTEVGNIPGTEVKHLTKVPVILLYSVYHPLADRASLTLADFKDTDFFVVSSEETTAAEGFVSECCAKYGFKPRIRSVSNSISVFSYVQSGLGVAIADLWNRECHNVLFKYIELGIFQDVSLVWRKDNPNPLLPLLVYEISHLFEAGD